ncbi:MAG: response regulator, partial [Proteobacteria bacterium]|nr:response regulator [Pseudomonadota bacterium]
DGVTTCDLVPDCNDFNATISPLQNEIVADGIDQDCSGNDSCYEDADNDTYGSTVWVRCRGVAIRNDEGKPVRMLVTHTDLTQVKNAENEAARKAIELNEARLEAERANRAKSAFRSSMSHELRTPLNCILGFAQLLELSEAEFDSKQKVHIRHILSSGEHLLNLVTDVLELHTIEEGRMSLKFDHVSADEVIEDCLNQIQFRARESEVQLIDGRKAQETLPRLWTDATRLKQLLLNLLSNAIKYNEEGGTVTISCSEMPGNMLRICVADTGAGIPLDRRKDLFTPFERLGRETGPIEGSGIGLSIAKRLIELLSGNIGYDSEVGKGSTFWVDIPLSQEQDLAGGDVESVVSAAPEQLTSPMEESNSRVILYIEDDPDNQSLMGHILARMPEFKIELLTAHNAELGLDLARKHRPDVVLLDINLPGMNGIDAVQKLKLMQETKAIPVIAISADATPQAIEGAMQHGFESYITKPINVREIQQTISKFLKPPTTH